MIFLAGYLPIVAAVTLLGVGLFVLSHNHKATVNLLFAAGMLATAGVDAALQRNRGNISHTATEIGVSRPTLHGLLQKHNLQAAGFRQR